MELTRKQLRRIIKEELEGAVNEASGPNSDPRDMMNWIDNWVKKGGKITGASFDDSGDQIKLSISAENKNGIEANKFFYAAKPRDKKRR